MNEKQTANVRVWYTINCDRPVAALMKSRNFKVSDKIWRVLTGRFITNDGDELNCNYYHVLRDAIAELEMLERDEWPVIDMWELEEVE